jgi:hypothetical protein
VSPHDFAINDFANLSDCARVTFTRLLLEGGKSVDPGKKCAG